MQTAATAVVACFFTLMMVVVVAIPATPSNALDEMTTIQPFDSTTTTTTTTTTTQRTKPSIRGCPPTVGKNSNNNCISTSNIKQLDTYSPPWTFEVSPQEAFARLKGIVNSDPSLDLVEIDEEDKYMRIETKRLAASVVDYIEFIVKDDDKVVVFQSAEKNPVDGGAGGSGISDFGAIRKRLEDLRRRSGGVFGVMGEGLTADSFDGGAFGKRNGLGGQLKAFYGFNSGEGFESVFE